jgi:hypothetical protein
MTSRGAANLLADPFFKETAMIRRFAFTGLSITCVLLAASWASAGKPSRDVLKLVPDSALGVVVLNRPSTLDFKIQALGRQLQLPIPSPLAILGQQTGLHEGLDETASIALLVLPPQGKLPMPTPIILVPVTDYDKFLAQFNPEGPAGGISKIKIMDKETLARSIGGYAALTGPEFRESLETGLTLAGEVPAGLAAWRGWLNKNDVAALVLQPGIKQASAAVQQGIQVMKSQLANAPDEQTKAAAGVFDMYAKLFQAAEKELTGHGLGLQLDQSGTVRVVSRTALVPEGNWAQLVGQCPPSKENFLAGLPAGPFVMAGGATIPAAAWEAMLKMSMDLMKSMPQVYGMSAQQTNKLPEMSLESMKQVHSLSMVMGVPAKGQSMYSNMVGIMRVDNAQTFMVAYEKDLTKNFAFFKAAKSPMFGQMEVKPGEVGGVAALEMTMGMPQFPAGPAAQQQTKVMEAMMGPGGKLNVWIVPADEHHVVFGYVGKESLQRAIAAIKEGTPDLDKDVQLATTSVLLPTGANMVAYVSPAGMIDFVKQMAGVTLPPGINPLAKLPAFPATPPVGFALTTAPNELQTEFVVPADVVQAIRQFTMDVMAKQSGAQFEKP